MATDNKNKVLNVPHLRFPEFGGEWRKYKLAEICSFFSGGTPSSSKKEYYDGNIPFIRSGELHMDKTELFITEVGLDNSAAKIVDVGDLLLALYGATSGDIAISQIKGAINQAILCIRTTQNKKFIESVWKKHVEKLLQTYLQGGQGNLSADIVKNISFYFAESNEQIKLAKFITLLDERIATQNKIIDKLQSLIKGLVVTHYSTNPHTIKAKIRDLGEAYSTMSMSKEQLTANGNPCIFYGELFTIYGCVIDEVKSKTHIKKEVSTLSRGRDLLFPASTTVDALSLIVPSTLMEKDIILGGDMFAIKISQEYNPLYLSYYFNYIANKRLSKYAKGTTIIHLHYNEIANVVVELPSIEEQGKIIAAIQGYTTKLDIEEALLERILDLKQYLLRQMFI